MDLAAARRRYGDFPVEPRTLPLPPEDFRRASPRWEGGRFAAAALVWNDRGEVALLRHVPGAFWRDEWATPGGTSEPGEEDPEATLRREVREEVGIGVRVDTLTKVIEYTLTDGVASVGGLFFQFEAVALSDVLRPGDGIAEARWHESLPAAMAYRKDYEDMFERSVRRRRKD